MKINKKIIELMKKNNLSQESFAELLNVSRQTVSNWENDKCYPDIETLIIISKKYNLSLDELLRDDIEMVKSIDKKIKSSNMLKKAIIIVIFISLLVLGSYYYYCQNKIKNIKSNILVVDRNKLLLTINKDIISNAEVIHNNDLVDIYLKEDDINPKELVARKVKIVRVNNFITVAVEDMEYSNIQKKIYEGYKFEFFIIK